MLVLKIVATLLIGLGLWVALVQNDVVNGLLVLAGGAVFWVYAATASGVLDRPPERGPSVPEPGTERPERPEPPLPERPPPEPEEPNGGGDAPGRGEIEPGNQ